MSYISTTKLSPHMVEVGGKTAQGKALYAKTKSLVSWDALGISCRAFFGGLSSWEIAVGIHRLPTRNKARVGKTISSHQFPPQKDEGVSQT